MNKVTRVYRTLYNGVGFDLVDILFFSQNLVRSNWSWSSCFKSTFELPEN